MLIQGRLLVDPFRSPEPGWIRVEGARIAEVGFGDVPKGAGPPSAGGRDALVCPAFLDAHNHLPQFGSVGCDGMPLLEWLRTVIFPAEGWWGRGMALSAARCSVRRLAMAGTCGFAGYLTSHGEAAREVLGYLAGTPMRWIAGRVAMDRNAPDDLTADDRERAKTRPVRPPVMPEVGASPRQVVSANPRFAVSCSEELLAEIGWWVREHPGAWVQTHLAESMDECGLIRELFPKDRDYTSVYDRFGLLTERTLLAHTIHLSEDEWKLIVARKSIVVHCPTANTFLEAGLFDLGAARRHGARVALGTDVAAGADVAMPRVARAMIEVAKMRRMTAASKESRMSVVVPSPAEAWWMITRGNAELLGWNDAGRIAEGAAADLLVLRVPDGWLDPHLVGRLIYGWENELIETRVFNGTIVDTAKL